MMQLLKKTTFLWFSLVISSAIATPCTIRIEISELLTNATLHCEYSENVCISSSSGYTVQVNDTENPNPAYLSRVSCPLKNVAYVNTTILKNTLSVAINHIKPNSQTNYLCEHFKPGTEDTCEIAVMVKEAVGNPKRMDVTCLSKACPPDWSFFIPTFFSVVEGVIIAILAFKLCRCKQKIGSLEKVAKNESNARVNAGASGFKCDSSSDTKNDNATVNDCKETGKTTTARSKSGVDSDTGACITARPKSGFDSDTGTSNLVRSKNGVDSDTGTSNLVRSKTGVDSDTGRSNLVRSKNGVDSDTGAFITARPNVTKNIRSGIEIAADRHLNDALKRSRPGRPNIEIEMHAIDNADNNPGSFTFNGNIAESTLAESPNVYFSDVKKQTSTTLGDNDDDDGDADVHSKYAGEDTALLSGIKVYPDTDNSTSGNKSEQPLILSA